MLLNILSQRTRYCVQAKLVQKQPLDSILALLQGINQTQNRAPEMQSWTKLGKRTLNGRLTGGSMECSLRPLPWGRREDWLHQGHPLPGALRYPVCTKLLCSSHAAHI